MNGGLSGDDDRLSVQHCSSHIGMYEDPNSLPAVPKHQFAKGITDVPGEDTAGITLQSLKITHFYDKVEHFAGKEPKCPVVEVDNPQYEYGGASRVVNSDDECRSQSSASAKDIKVILRWILIGSFLIGCVILLVIAIVFLTSSQRESQKNKVG